MRRLKFSLLLGLIIIVTSPLHFALEKFLVKIRLLNLLSYFLLGVLLALFLISFLRTIAARKVLDLAALLLALIVLFYLLFPVQVYLHRSGFSFLLHIFGFFLIGFLLFKENKRIFSLLPFIIVVAVAVGFEWFQLILPGRVFAIRDIWINGMAGFCGLIVGYH